MDAPPKDDELDDCSVFTKIIGVLDRDLEEPFLYSQDRDWQYLGLFQDQDHASSLWPVKARHIWHVPLAGYRDWLPGIFSPPSMSEIMVGIQVLSETMYSVFSTQHTQLFHVIHVCDAGNNDKRRSAEYYATSIAGFFVACQCKDRYRSRALICDSGRDDRI